MNLSIGERASLGTLSIAALTLLAGLGTRLFLVCGDALFKLFWKRNTDFVQARAAEQFGAQLKELATLPAAIHEQTRVMRAVLSVQRQHGEAIASVVTAVNMGLGADLDSPLRRRAPAHGAVHEPTRYEPPEHVLEAYREAPHDGTAQDDDDDGN